MANNWIQLPSDLANSGKQVRANTITINVAGSSTQVYQHTYTPSDPNQDLQANIFYSGYLGASYVALHPSQLPLTVGGSVTSTVNFPNNQSVNLTQINGTPITLGQGTMFTSLPVVLPSQQLPLAISGSVTATVSPTANQSVNLTQVGGSAITLGQTNKANSLPVVLPSDQLPLSVNGGVTAFQGTTPWNENITQFGGVTVTLGQNNMANSIPVVLPSNQPLLTISGSVTANQGAPNTIPNAWPITVTNAATAVNVNVTSPNPTDGRLTVGSIPRVQGAVLTTTQLAANAIYTSQWFDTQASGTMLVKATAYSDQSSAASGFQFQLSQDISNSLLTSTPTTLSVTAGSYGSIVQTVHSRYWRIVYINGATLTTQLEIAINEKTQYGETLTNTTPSGTEYAPIVRNIPSGTQNVSVIPSALPLTVGGSVTATIANQPIQTTISAGGSSASITPSGALLVTPIPSSTQGWTPSLQNGLTTTVKSVKTAQGSLGGWYIYNPNAAVGYIQIFDAATAGAVTLGSTTPKLSIGIPSTAAANVNLGDGVIFNNGIQIATTTTSTGATANSSPIDCNFWYV